MSLELTEDPAISNLKVGSIIQLRIWSLDINDRYYFLERRRIFTQPKGQSEYDHLFFVEQPNGRIWVNTFDARRLRMDGDCVVEKTDFDDRDFGRTYWIMDYTYDSKVVDLARKAFGK